jgi:tetratricopeptide (TPR) repeat protein
MNSSIFKDIPYDAEDLIRNKGNALINFLCNYFLNRRLISVGIEFFANLVSYDKRYLIFLIEMLLKTPYEKETISAIASILESTPHVLLFLYKEAQILTKLGKYEESVPLLKTVLQLNPNSCEAWIALSEVYFLQKKYVEVLFTLNAMPFYTTGGEIEGTDDNFCEEMKKLRVAFPASVSSISNCPSFFSEPKSTDFIFDNICDEMTYLQSGDSNKSEKLVEKYNKLPAKGLSWQMQAAYKLLVKINRDIGWNQLLSLRANIFVIESDSDTKKTKRSQDVKLKEENKIEEDYEINSNSEKNEQDEQTPKRLGFEHGLDMNEASFCQLEGMVDHKIDEILRGLKDNGPIPATKKGKSAYEALEDEGNGDRENLLEEEAVENEEDFYKKSKQKLEKRKKKLEFADTTWKQLEEDERLRDLNTERGGKKRKLFSTQELNKVGKRLCTKDFDELFDFLYKDNNAYFKFLDKQKKSQEKREKDKSGKTLETLYNGKFWLER